MAGATQPIFHHLPHIFGEYCGQFWCGSVSLGLLMLLTFQGDRLALKELFPCGDVHWSAKFYFHCNKFMNFYSKCSL